MTRPLVYTKFQAGFLDKREAVNAWRCVHGNTSTLVFHSRRFRHVCPLRHVSEKIGSENRPRVCVTLRVTNMCRNIRTICILLFYPNGMVFRDRVVYGIPRSLPCTDRACWAIRSKWFARSNQPTSRTPAHIADASSLLSRVSNVSFLPPPSSSSAQCVLKNPPFSFASGSDQDGEEDSKLCQELMANAPHGQDDSSKYWSRSLRMYAAQSHPEEFALVGIGSGFRGKFILLRCSYRQEASRMPTVNIFSVCTLLSRNTLNIHIKTCSQSVNCPLSYFFFPPLCVVRFSLAVVEAFNSPRFIVFAISRRYGGGARTPRK